MSMAGMESSGKALSIRPTAGSFVSPLAMRRVACFAEPRSALLSTPRFSLSSQRKRLFRRRNAESELSQSRQVLSASLGFFRSSRHWATPRSLNVKFVFVRGLLRSPESKFPKLSCERLQVCWAAETSA